MSDTVVFDSRIQTLREFPTPPRPKPTGRKLVLFRADADMAKIKQVVQQRSGSTVRDRRDFAGSTQDLNAELNAGGAVLFHRQKVAIVGNTQIQSEAFSGDDSVEMSRPEFYMFAISDVQRLYSEWVRQGLRILLEQSGSNPLSSFGALAAGVALAPFGDTNQITWGLQAVGVPTTTFTGEAIKVAVLDTGLDFEHPDFVGRDIVRKSFVDGDPSAQDVQGHGTHTAGSVAGPINSKIGRRYGVAPNVKLHVGKVLNNSGVGKEAEIIDGMNWAIDEKCVVISMSLGRPTQPGEAADQTYERTAASALDEDCLIIAAAGNESARDFGFIAPVAAPANSPSVMAVAAVDPLLKVAPFSCGGISPGIGSAADISGPGVSVYSSYPLPRESRTLPGTSMACPHVAGVAALWAESNPQLRGRKLWNALVSSARPLGNAQDFGAGLAQAPGAGTGV